MLENTNIRSGGTGECTTDMEDRITKITQSEKQKEKTNFKNENSMAIPWQTSG